MSLCVAELFARRLRTSTRHVVCKSFQSSAAQSSRGISSHTRHTLCTRPPSASFSSTRTGLKLRRYLQTQRFQSFTPPSPESLGKAAPAKQYRRSIKWGRRLLYVSATSGLLYLVDTQLYASSLTRTLRTFGLGLVVALDYKLNFRPEPFFGGDIGALHRRNAEKLFNLLHQNGGLYLKIGQAIAMQSAVLPPEFQKMFSRMFDDAPQNDWSDVERVIREDFGGRSAEEVFGVSFSNEPGYGVMEKKARASASVAQVKPSVSSSEIGC